MSNKDIFIDLYNRITSRKFILAVLAIGFAIFNYWNGSITAMEFQQAITTIVVAYVGVEGATDIVGAIKKPQQYDYNPNISHPPQQIIVEQPAPQVNIDATSTTAPTSAKIAIDEEKLATMIVDAMDKMITRRLQNDK